MLCKHGAAKVGTADIIVVGHDGGEFHRTLTDKQNASHVSCLHLGPLRCWDWSVKRGEVGRGEAKRRIGYRTLLQGG